MKIKVDNIKILGVTISTQGQTSKVSKMKPLTFKLSPQTADV